jgi:Uma2 family endonuclease
MGTKTLMSLAEFEALPDDGERHELIEGELIKMPPPKHGHDRVVRNIHNTLTKVAEQARRYVVYSEAGYLLQADSPIFLRPDVSVLAVDRDAKVSSNQYVNGAPDLAFEVVSPGDSADEIERKIGLYLSHGSSRVWVVYTTSRRIQVRQSSGISMLSEDSLIDAPEIFPGWSVRVSDLLV